MTAASLLKKIAILTVVSIVVTALAVVAAGFGAGACHCSTPPAVVFPYGTATQQTEALAGWLVLLQYPVYVFALGFARGERARIALAALLIVLHAAAGYVAMTTGHH